MWTSYKIVLFS